MTTSLIPRLTTDAARRRLGFLEDAMRQGASPQNLVEFEVDEAIPNATGGQPVRAEELREWRRAVRYAVDLSMEKRVSEQHHGIALGKAIHEVINPVRSDAGHDGCWSFLSLYIFPDLVHARWPGKESEGRLCLTPDRWIGAQVGRDRNYLKLAWHRWQVLGGVMAMADPPIGEDEFGSLLERTAVARNQRLVRAAAAEVTQFRDPRLARSVFAREFMKRVCYQTGARSLDILSDAELSEVVQGCAAQVLDMLTETEPAIHPVAAEPEEGWGSGDSSTVQAGESKVVAPRRWWNRIAERSRG